MEKYPKYPHLENLDRVREFIYEDLPVTITEKLHGFNARFGKTDKGEFWIGTRNNVINPETERLQGFTAAALSMQAFEDPGITFYGEWAGKGVQKGIDYGVPRFFLFGVRFGDTPVLSDTATLLFWAKVLDCVTVPFIFEGPCPSIGTLDAWRKDQSSIAVGPREGIVIAPLEPIYGPGNSFLIAKFKSAEFEERAHAKKKDRKDFTLPDLSTVKDFVDEYVTETRLEHVLEQLKENALDGTDIRNTGTLLKTMYDDVVREGKLDYDKLEPEHQKMVGKVLNSATKILVDAYKLRS